ncbi:Ankyrin repeat-containing protein C6C3.08 [Psilocybe cubensis]|uniref:Ankyrin repeat-containing protein C6C3.08 n=2 Tax=Psilocybe cubensis TaxID=181762 RepID=A0ACB8H1Z2_PSICU|nr:Ankyrin repeat-containing protein C6C3.08 [Psilocybe cubensis]KAH9481869.1 Ankyrin repeat-containing protein C6C3.08 [Psilocybe cubensis]
MSSLTVHSAAQKSAYNPQTYFDFQFGLTARLFIDWHPDQLPLLRSLLAEDPKLVNSVDADGRTPLHWAASSGSAELVQFLIDQKAEVDKVDGSGWSPLHIAGKLHASFSFRLPLICMCHILVSAGNLGVVQELIGAGADVNRKNDNGLTPLHYAASKSRIDIGRLLISRGADGWKYFLHLFRHRAATTGSVGFIRLLIESSTPSNKLRLNTADRIGNTPLHLAMDSAHAEAAVVLINAGADRTRENLDEETPEAMEGVGGSEQRKARQYVIDSCGKP